MTVSAQINKLQYKDFFEDFLYQRGGFDILCVCACVGGGACKKFFRGLKYFEEGLFLGEVYQKYTLKHTIFKEFLGEYDPIPLLIAQHAVPYQLLKHLYSFSRQIY